jgi:hypothetical protein
MPIMLSLSEDACYGGIANRTSVVSGEGLQNYESLSHNLSLGYRLAD